MDSFGPLQIVWLLLPDDAGGLLLSILIAKGEELGSGSLFQTIKPKLSIRGGLVTRLVVQQIAEVEFGIKASQS